MLQVLKKHGDIWSAKEDKETETSTFLSTTAPDGAPWVPEEGRSAELHWQSRPPNTVRDVRRAGPAALEDVRRELADAPTGEPFLLIILH